MVGVAELGDGFTKLVAMPYCLSGDFSDVFIAAQESMRIAMNEAQIGQPIPHQVHIKKDA